MPPDAAVVSESAAELERLKQTPEYQRLKKLYADREWRLDNLYWIKDKNGDEVLFKRNTAQRHYSKSQWYRDTILKSRQLGFSTFIAILILDDAIFRPNTPAGIVDLTLDDAKAKLAKIKFAYDKLPALLRAAVPLVPPSNSEELTWANGSSVSVGTSYRGGTVWNLHISEFGAISARTPEVAKEIKTGAFPAVPLGGRIWVESTAKGTHGEFADQVDRGRKAAASGQVLTKLDFKFQFFGWHMDPANRLPNNLVMISHEMREYFTELESKYGIKTDADQHAWYVKTREELGPDEMLSEHPSHPDEAFFSSMQGAYWRAEMTRARLDKRIGLPVPFDKTRPVNTWWDIGHHDQNAIWFHQTDGVRHRFIDYYEAPDEGLPQCIAVLNAKKAARGFTWGQHIGPHDLGNTEWLVGDRTRKQMAKGMGVEFKVVDRVLVKLESIEAARRLLGMSYFCSEYTEQGVACLDNYSKAWNKSLAMFMQEAAKNGYQHGADAFQQGALFHSPERPAREGRRSRDKRRGSAMAA